MSSEIIFWVAPNGGMQIMIPRKNGVGPEGEDIVLVRDYIPCLGTDLDYSAKGFY